MRKVVHIEAKCIGPKTWFRGKDLTDRIWVSSEIDVIRASYLPFNRTLGDHRSVMADPIMSLVLKQN